MATGISTATTPDYYNTHGNPANITYAKRPIFSFAHLQFSIDGELSEQIFSFILPSKLGNFAVNLYRYGNSAYQKLESGLNFAKQFGKKLSLGLKANYHQLSIQNYGSRSALSIDVGMKYQLDTGWIIGFHINNLHHINSLNALNQDAILKPWSIGVGYAMSDRILFSLTAQKTLEFDGGLSIEYQPASALALRMGISLSPFTQYIGLGLFLRKFTVDLAVENSPQLLQKPQLGITYAF